MGFASHQDVEVVELEFLFYNTLQSSKHILSFSLLSIRPSILIFENCWAYIILWDNMCLFNVSSFHQWYKSFPNAMQIFADVDFHSRTTLFDEYYYNLEPPFLYSLHI